MAQPPPIGPIESWSRATRLIVSVLLVLHLAVVVIAPWSGPPPSSELSRRCAAIVLPYMKFMSLDNGYRFFAPDPGPSHLVKYELLKDGAVVDSGWFPNRSEHFPRLLYHRFFMIAETLASQMPPPMSDQEREALPIDERQRYELAQRHARPLQRSLARQLLERHPQADAVRLYLQRHLIPSPPDVLLGKSLNDSSYYEQFLIGEFSRKDASP